MNVIDSPLWVFQARIQNFQSYAAQTHFRRCQMNITRPITRRQDTNYAPKVAQVIKTWEGGVVTVYMVISSLFKKLSGSGRPKLHPLVVSGAGPKSLFTSQSPLHALASLCRSFGKWLPSRFPLWLLLKGSPLHAQFVAKLVFVAICWRTHMSLQVRGAGTPDMR